MDNVIKDFRAGPSYAHGDPRNWGFRRAGPSTAAGSICRARDRMPVAGDPVWSRLSALIPVRLNIDTRPLPGAGGADAIWIGNQPIPRGFAGFEDVVIGVPRPGRTICSVASSPRRSPSGLVQVNRGQRQQTDVVRHDQLLATLMPAGTVVSASWSFFGCTGRGCGRVRRS
jgi:hypothetical protein